MNKVGILYICTGYYSVFWSDFFSSAERYLLPHSEKHYFVFTDTPSCIPSHPRVHVYFQKKLKWPYITLQRFHIFLQAEKELMHMDYLFFFNANMLITGIVDEAELLPGEKQYTFVTHPGYYNKERKDFPYEKNPASCAYISDDAGSVYICGGLNGGRRDAYIALIKRLKEAVDKDLDQRLIAVWHDESHINAFCASASNYKLLSPSYCYPEDWELPFDAKVLVRNKEKYIPTAEIKAATLKKRLVLACKRVAKKLLHIRNI